MKILQVTQVTVIKQSDNPLSLFIQASGLAASTGWINPRLDGSKDPNPEDAVLEFSFEADRPGGITLPVLTPITASAVVTPKNGADAIVVAARTNSVTVHASEFRGPAPTTAGSPERLTTLAVGEETPPSTTLRLGEEGPILTTFRIGEEGPFPTTLRFGEEGPLPTTLRLGEEGPWTDPRVDDPIGLTALGGGETTLAVGEEGGDPSTMSAGEDGGVFGGGVIGGGNPFGWF